MPAPPLRPDPDSSSSPQVASAGSVPSAASPAGDLGAKEARLRAQLADAGRLIVAFSGGVDSAYLAWVAHDVLGAGALAVTALSPSYPAHHREMAERIVGDFGLAHRFVETDEMTSPAYRANAPDRCYHCKSALFERLDRLAAEEGFDTVAYGVNADDTSDFRPGHRAAAEHSVRSPLLEAELGKAEVRTLSRTAGLPTWDLPASACLSSRLPYGTEVTPERLHQVEEGEARLRALGFSQVRLRHHGDLARIEIAPDEMPRALDADMTKRLTAAIKPLGFRWVSLDLDGYRMGSLNEVLFIRSDQEKS